MTGHGLSGAHGHLMRVLSEGAFDRDRFDAVSQRRGSAVRIDVVDLVRLQARRLSSRAS